MSVILASLEMEMRKVEVQGQLRQNESKTVSQKYPTHTHTHTHTHTRTGRVAQASRAWSPEFKPEYQKNYKKYLVAKETFLSANIYMRHFIRVCTNRLRFTIWSFCSHFLNGEQEMSLSPPDLLYSHFRDNPLLVCWKGIPLLINLTVTLKKKIHNAFT
jgi:hypothetical protein